MKRRHQRGRHLGTGTHRRILWLLFLFLFTALAVETAYGAGSGAAGAVSPTPAPEEEVYTYQKLSLSDIPPYSGQPYADINGDVPFFHEMTTLAFDGYGPLDELGRCTVAYACVGPETMPKEKREDISSVLPSGWNDAEYTNVDGGKLFNHCHLIGFQLTGQNANERNLITGTRYMNTEGMLPFENSVAQYIETTGNHVMYRVTPLFEGDNLVAAGVLMEAKSVEDPLVQYCVFCYNVQPGVTIDYATGESTGPAAVLVPDSESAEAPAERAKEEEPAEKREEKQEEKAEEKKEEPADPGTDYILNTNTKKFHYPTCASVKKMKDKNKKEFHGTRDEVIAKGYDPCGNCHP